MSQPKIADDVLRKWHNASKFFWDETSKECGTCRIEFRTGDVCIVFGDMGVAISHKRFRCPSCGVEDITKGARPSASALFVENDHRNKNLTDLDPYIRDRVLQAFTMLDILHDNMQEAAAEFS